MASMEGRRQSLPNAAATTMVLAIAIVFFFSAAAPLASAASVEHTFVVSMGMLLFLAFIRSMHPSTVNRIHNQ
jgi:hypothetical protein